MQRQSVQNHCVRVPARPSGESWILAEHVGRKRQGWLAPAWPLLVVRGLAPALKMNTKPDFENGLAHYFLKDFAEAARSFEKVLQSDPEDKIARNYLLNCQAFLERGVPEAWPGIEVMGRK